MKKLTYHKETFDLLLNMAENNKCYWRYQGGHHNGLIPVSHTSHERVFDGEEPEHIEEGCSCYDNPWQLLEYMDDESNDLDTTDVILFVGSHMGYGIDDEDIVKVEEESDILYYLSLRDFYKFAVNVCDDLYWNTYNVKEKFCNFEDNFIENL